MKKLTVLFLFLLICMATESFAQSFASKKLSEIGELMPKSSLPASDSIFTCLPIVNGKQLVIQYNNKKEIEHLGVSLFSPETKKIINDPVCSFIERLMLELLLQKNSDDVAKKLQEYNITIEEKSLLAGVSQTPTLQKLLDKLQPPLQFMLHQEEATYYAGWQLNNGEQFTVSFPASRELIFGTNKKESDLSLSELLPKNRCDKKIDHFSIVTLDDLEVVPSNSNVFVRKGATFAFPEFDSHTYLKKNTDNSFFPVFDSNHPALSLKNLLLIKDINTTLKLHIKHKMYGNFSPEFEIAPSDFICFFQTEFDIYAHVDDSKQDVLNATVILYNRMYNYLHLLTIKTFVNKLFENNSVLDADFYSNIPQHNISNLFTN